MRKPEVYKITIFLGVTFFLPSYYNIIYKEDMFMELIPINESKLKIMLDESDMKEYNIGDEADCANSETRLAIRHILDRAKDQIGFNTEGSEIFVQLYTSKGGGCELFVTKSTISSDTIVSTSMPPEKRIKRRNESSPQRATSESRALPAHSESNLKTKRSDSGRLLYSFHSLSDLCHACNLLSKIHLPLESSAYKGNDGVCYLLLSGDNVKEYARLDKLTFLIEFGERERGYDLTTYLSEHTSAICREDAVKTLAQF